ncbi:hypothetical protein EHS13_13825 [Paenibacillus psychroresistens]|uniref:Putative tail fiber protein gp53-like C-terminal domain-containing protein n=1 Tax=Paenibacillus psychroresistens TaxID=1778678 RepID=A0A6B8RJ41_9BACL|nr:hypothetical protein [Paenibacillus psychroresistens]QGQ95877.1 hypothetical protein EHS13_13825 [Paenibacillus psychroresistens]
MGAFGGLFITNKGRALQAKAQTGVVLVFNRIAMGDGTITSQVIADLNSLISQKKTLAIEKLRTLGAGKAVVGGSFSNGDIVTGFYFRELGVFAQDPDEGEILYCYANAGAGAEYIPAGGGPDIVQKFIDVVTIVGNVATVSATINESLVFTTVADFNTHKNAATLDHPDSSVITAKIAPKAVTAAKIADNTVGAGQMVAGAATDTVIGNRTPVDTVSAVVGADTPTNLFSKLANMIKQITGGATWATAATTNLAALLTAMGLRATISNPVFTGTVTLGQDPASALQAATKQYVDAYALGLDTKVSCRAVATSNITLSGTQTVDGVVLVVGNRILVSGQTTASQNGIYVVAAGAWARSSDADTSAEVTSGMYTYIEEGTANGKNGWSLLTADPIVLGTTALTFTLFNGPGSVVAGAGLNKTGNTLSIPASSVTDSMFGTRTIVDSTAQTGGAAAAPTTLWSQLGNMIKGITGKVNWYTLPVVSLETLNVTTPKVSTSDMTYYVRTDGSNSNTGLGNTAGGAFLTIAKAVSMIPQILNHTYTISIAAGTYAETVNITGLSGSGNLVITAATVINVNNVKTTSVGVRLQLNSINAATTTLDGFYIEYCQWVYLQSCQSTGITATGSGVLCYGSKVIVSGGTFANKANGIASSGVGSLYSYSNSGTGNTRGLFAIESSVIGIQSGQPSGVTNMATSSGGVISPDTGVINPWGDNTSAISKAASGYQKFPSGLIIQWGNFTGVATGGVITFPLAFPTLCASVVANLTSGPTSPIISAANFSTTNTNIYSSTGATMNGSYVAIGY